MSWFASWLPSIPTISLSIPTSIQSRFISFFLKKSLGHFFKPGQLDTLQIDSQIGSGYVQINDLELDPGPINQHLKGLPLVLEEGTVKAVTVRIPWPNPLTSVVGFSLDSLHLRLRIETPLHEAFPQEVDLADSVASVAETFVQEELSGAQEAQLWESFSAAAHSQDPEDHNVPGGLEFISGIEKQGDYELDPAGVSIFATLIERLLARFQFDARDIQVTVVDPENISLKFSLSEIRYTTNEVGGQDENVEDGTQRTLSLHGMTLTALGYPIEFEGSVHTPSTTRPGSPSDVETDPEISSPDSSPRSSTSSFDEDTQFQMSQSLVGLPPPHLADSMAGSIYHSIMSEHPESEDAPAISTSEIPLPDERTILSFGAVPFEITLTTPSPGGSHSSGGPSAAMHDRYQLHAACGFIAIALQPWHVSRLLSAALKMSNPHMPPPRQSSTAPEQPVLSFDAELQVRSVIILLYSSSNLQGRESLESYFSRPLVPPQLQSGYTRLLLDSLSAQASSLSTGVSSTMRIGDINIFQFTDPSSRKGEAQRNFPVAIPVLITDSHLPSQYDPNHAYPSRTDPFHATVVQPTIPAVNWSDRRHFTCGAKLSHWRTRDPSERQSTDGPNRQSAIYVTVNNPTTLARGKTGIAQSRQAKVDIIPLHIFADLEYAQLEGGIIPYIDELLKGIEALDRKKQRSRAYLSDEEEDFNRPEDSTQLPAKSDPHQNVLKSVLTCHLRAVRLSVRAPPPPGRGKRSGILTADVHNISIRDSADENTRHLRFERHASTGPDHHASDGDKLLAQVHCERIVIGCSSSKDEHFVAVLSLGPLQTPSQSTQLLFPRVTVKQREIGGNALVLSVDIPSVYVSLSRPQLEALHFWIDDLSQALERMTVSRTTNDGSGQNSKDPSMIGSRFFARSRTGSAVESPRIEGRVKTIISLGVTEAYIRLHLPRSGHDGSAPRPFDVACSDLNANVKLHATGKIEAIVNIMDADIQDTTVTESVRTFLSLTTTRSLTATPTPMIKLKFISSTIPETTAKENRVSVSLYGFTFNLHPDLALPVDLGQFFKSPPGTFESVVPSERTLISLKIIEGSVRSFAPTHSGAIVLAIGGLNFVTDIVGQFPDPSFRLDIATMFVLAVENVGESNKSINGSGHAIDYWKRKGYALLVDVSAMKLKYQESSMSPPEKQVVIDGVCLKVHACADTFGLIGAFVSDIASLVKPTSEGAEQRHLNREPPDVSPAREDDRKLSYSIDDVAFRRIPDVGSAPDMIHDDLPTNLDYLDESFGAAAGLRELTDDDLDEFDTQDIEVSAVHISATNTGVVSSVGGETIKLLSEDGIDIIEDFYGSLPSEVVEDRPSLNNEKIRVRIHNCDVYLLLYDGYDWPRTRKIIEDEVKEMRKRLAKIRQLVASGQSQEPVDEDTSALLFNSVYIGLDQDLNSAEPEAFIAAIDEELKDDIETGTQSSWQSLKHPGSAQPKAPSVKVHGKKLTRSKGPSMEFCLSDLNAEFNQYGEDSVIVSRTFLTVKDLEILDHIKTSTWKKFLTALRSDSKGNIRETGANMVRIELHNVRPSPGQDSQEARVRAKILPIRLYVDQDAVDFLKKFFSFKDPNAGPAPSGSEPNDGDAYIQMAEIFPIDLKLDYKPRRVDYRALKEGKTIELMNFFHFDGAEMTLRHITLSGITGWPKMFEMLNDLWTPDVKATQLVEVISGVAPIRSVVNVGSGVADLVLLPISQYKKDGRIVRGVQKGATAFVKSTAIEAIKMGARLATGTQVILEQAEGLLGGEFDRPITAETLSLPYDEDDETDEDADLISKYAQQPADLKEGFQSAYKSLQRNLNSAAQTILAVPMEVYERSGNEGPVRSVIRAVPIAVLKPMIGATEAVSKTLLGLHNTLDPNVRLENEAKYK
ncbi:hypothetical protein FA15DRAFT_663305 [Coprinopsis marcescibilis]|uniref:Autophagy-related protein 2 n=1 Tax=Coprinopsis marcescibilis TaxID=230819 RepID=A0A5C3LBG5_COPMA|nr:hypothetical protein FA15DRAFT_663305 [Coprinopsis marcescibilis]